jgi:hypothetical protein
MTFIRIAFSAVLLAVVTTTAFAHSGGTDGNGCHYDRQKGGHHCH